MPRAQAGYALIEILVSLAISAFVTLALGQFLAVSGRTSASAAREISQAEALEGAGRVLKFLTDKVMLEETSATRPSVVGTSTSLSILTRGPTALGLNNEHIFEIATVNLAGQKAAVLSWRSQSGSASGNEPITGPGLHFTFSYRPKNGGPDEWLAEWRLPASQLSAIRVRLFDSRNELIRTQFFFVKPLVPPSCVIEAFSHLCPVQSI